METNNYIELATDDLLGPLNDLEQKNAPTSLFISGDRSLLNTGARVSIVGSRKASDLGIARAKKLARILVEHQAVVVSGLADGIDTAAHTAAIHKGGKTIAVIGTPLDEVYPKKNAPLQAQIMQEHLCVSQFPVGKPVQRKNFVLRNRTMALLSDTTVIIEAKDGSGSLHQAWEAIRLGRQLYISKVVADDSSLKWPAELLHYGAQLLADATLDSFLEFVLLSHRTESGFDGAISF